MKTDFIFIYFFYYIINGRTINARGQESLQSYLVNASGSIDFPVLGKLQVGGLTRSELMQLLEGKISKYIKNPIINIRLMNFKVSVQGEVNLPGTYSWGKLRLSPQGAFP